MATSLRHRLLRGAGAQAYAQVVQLFVRLAEIPAFLLIWDATRYGEWLVVAAIPTYLSFADGGFATTSAREMTIRLGANDKQGALSVYRSSRALLIGIGIVGALISALLIFATPVIGWFVPDNGTDVRQALMVLVVFVFLGFQSGLSYGVFCAEKRYALGTMIGTSFQLTDLAFSLGGAWYFDSLTGAASGLLVSRLLMNLTYALMLRRVAPWCRFGWLGCTFRQIRELALPSLGSMAVPIGIGNNISGMRILVGVILGPAAVPLFSALRTLARSAQTPMLLITRIAEPELAIAFGANDLDTVRALFRHSCQIAVWCGVALAVFMLPFGQLIFVHWVHAQFALDWPTFLILLAASVINGFWYTAMQVAYATNRMHKVAVPFALIYGFGCVLLAWPLLTWLGTAGAAVSLCIAEIAMCAITVPLALKLTGENASNLLRTVMSVPTFKVAHFR